MICYWLSCVIHLCDRLIYLMLIGPTANILFSWLLLHWTWWSLFWPKHVQHELDLQYTTVFLHFYIEDCHGMLCRSGRCGSGGKSCRLAVEGLPVWSHPGRGEMSLSKTPNPQLLLTSWLVPCMVANRRWCVNVCEWVNERHKLYSALDKGAIKMQSIYHCFVFASYGFSKGDRHSLNFL